MNRRVFLGLAWLIACAAAAPGQQVTELKAFHRSGQTFLSWKALETYGEIPADQLAKGGLAGGEYKNRIAERDKAAKAGAGLSYHVYRSDRPLSQDALESASLVGKVEPLSIYYAENRGAKIWPAGRMPAFCLEDQKPLAPDRECFVYTLAPGQKGGKAYYAVLAVRGGKIDTTLSAGNSLSQPIEESPGEPEPVLQGIHKVDAKGNYMYQQGPAEVRYYIRWVAEPYSNQPRRFIWAVAVPGKRDPKTPASLQVMVHGWGGSQDSGTYWYDVKPACIRLSSMNHPVQDWWYGYHEDYTIRNLRPEGVIRNYTEQRVMSMVQWAQKHWSIDPQRIFIEGQSMGGTGAIHIGGTRGDQFCYVNSWVGIACWPQNGWFRNGEQGKWGRRHQYGNYNGYKFDDWMDMGWWLRKFPQQETPFFSFANGKNDGQIGWEQAVRFVRALQETKRAFVFRWGMGGHGERAIFMFDPATMALDKPLPAFANCSLDDDLGTAKKLEKPTSVPVRDEKPREDWYDGAATGQINAHLRWQDASDQAGAFEITLLLPAGQGGPAEDECTVDFTPRRCRDFKAKSGEKFAWTNTELKGGKVVQSGTAEADQWGLVTIEKVKVSKSKNRVRIERAR